MKRLRHVGLLVAACLITSTVSAAPKRGKKPPPPAKPPEQTEPIEDDLRAKKLFDDGTRAFNLGEFQTAVQLYRQAYKLKPEPGLVYNIAQAYRLSNDPGNAVFFYRSFLRVAPNTPNRKEIEERIRKLEAQMADQKAPPNAPVGLGGLPPPSGSEGEGGEADKKPAAVATPATATTPASAQPTLTATPAAKPTPIYKKWWLWTVVGVGVVGIGLGVGLGLGLQPGAPSSHFGTRPIF